VGAVNHPFPIWDFFDTVHKNGALALQFLDHKAVVDDFLAHVDGRPKGLQGDADNINGPHHARSKATGLKQKQRLFVLVQDLMCVLAHVLMYGHTLPS
jgi:hypothetical protein